MNAIRIGSVESQLTGDLVTVTSRIGLPDREYSLFFRGPADAVHPSRVDPFVVACLPMAMATGLPLRVDGSVSARLLDSLPHVQEIFACWRPTMRVVAVDAQRRDEPALPASGAASFFSGGVDSFHTAFRQRQEVSMLVLVHGFDMALDRLALRGRVSAALRRSAERMGKRLVEIETNTRGLTDSSTSWLHEQVGASLASVALLLEPVAGRVFVPSTYRYDVLKPSGSHALTDPLWSSEAVTIVHDGAVMSRAQKVAEIAREPIALESLRVCWRNPDDAYNCGRCEKCVRTMLALAAVGALERCPVFEAPLDPRAVAAMEINKDGQGLLMQDNLRALRESGRHPELVAALEHVLRRRQGDALVRALAAQSLVEWRTFGRSIIRHAVRSVLARR